MAGRNFILHNFGWKLVSLLLAALTWLTIQTALHKSQEESGQSQIVTVHSRTFTNILVTLMASPYNTNQYRINPPQVAVQLDGDEDDLAKLQEDQITAYVDVTRFEGDKEVFKDVQIQAPRDFKVSSVKPRWASVIRINPLK